MTVKIVELDVSGQWDSDDELLEKLTALFLTASWCNEMVISNVRDYGPAEPD